VVLSPSMLSKILRKPILLAAVLVVSMTAIPGIGASAGTSSNLIVNGNFDSGSFSPGWNVDNGGAGAWAVSSTGTASGASVTVTPDPGSQVALFDMLDPSYGILTTDPFTVPVNGVLTLNYAYNNEAGGWIKDSINPYSLSAHNQWLRIDVIKASAAATTLNPSDILATIFDSQSGSPAFATGWTAGSATLAPFAGQSVVFRVEAVDTQFFLPVWVSHVFVAGDTPQTSSPPPSSLSVTGGHGSISAVFGAPSQGATSYSCSLILGSTVIKTTTNTPYLFNTDYGCSFKGLKGNTAYGVSVVAMNQFGASPAVTEWTRTLSAPVTRTTITCVDKMNHYRTVTGAHPTCPAGFHRV